MFNRYQYAVLTALEQLEGNAKTRMVAKCAHEINKINKLNGYSADLYSENGYRALDKYPGATSTFYKALNQLIAEGFIAKMKRFRISFVADLEDSGWQRKSL